MLICCNQFYFKEILTRTLRNRKFHDVVASQNGNRKGTKASTLMCTLRNLEYLHWKCPQSNTHPLPYLHLHVG